MPAPTQSGGAAGDCGSEVSGTAKVGTDEQRLFRTAGNRIRGCAGRVRQHNMPKPAGNNPCAVDAAAIDRKDVFLPG